MKSKKVEDVCIHDLELHEYVEIDSSTLVARVPGGWIYQVVTPFGINGTFVPFNEEFK